jgi:hypothetical protein
MSRIFEGGMNFPDSPKKKRSCLGKLGNGFLILVGLAIVSSALTSLFPNSSSSDATKQSSTQVQETDHCSAVRTSVTMIRTAFSEGKATPQEMSLLLDSAIGDWSFAAQLSTGSKSEWLQKMADLGSDVKNYILTGEPSNGPQSLDQLVANMNLVDQFCG